TPALSPRRGWSFRSAVWVHGAIHLHTQRKAFHEPYGLRRFWSAPLCGAFGSEVGSNDLRSFAGRPSSVPKAAQSAALQDAGASFWVRFNGPDACANAKEGFP